MRADQAATIDLMRANARLREALAAMMEGSVFLPSPLHPEGTWHSIRAPSESALNLARAALSEDCT